MKYFLLSILTAIPIYIILQFIRFESLQFINKSHNTKTNYPHKCLSNNQILMCMLDINNTNITDMKEIVHVFRGTAE